MKYLRKAVTAFLLVTTPFTLSATTWTPVTWRGESSYAAVSDTGDWHAIVSVERGRLVHFGVTDDAADNLILATPTRDDPVGWGGHRVWLGPQREWPRGWPPPDAWEHSSAVPEVEGNTLVLTPPATGHDWPDLARTYRWDGDRLLCGVRVSGPARAVQVIQIIQFPATATVLVTPEVSDDAPSGYVLLPFYARNSFLKEFTSPATVETEGERILIRHGDEPLKFGFTPRALRSLQQNVTLTVAPESLTGEPAGELNQGYYTEVFLGGREPFIELEQLSPPLNPASPQREFVISIAGAKSNN